MSSPAEEPATDRQTQVHTNKENDYGPYDQIFPKGRLIIDQGDGTFLVISGTGGDDNLGNHIATQDLDMSGFAIFGIDMMTLLRRAAPSDPAANMGRFYVKQIDANNDGVFVKIKRAGSYKEVQIV